MRPSVDPHPELDLHIAASAELMDTDTMPPSLTEDILRKHHVDIAVRFGRGYYPGCDVEPLMQVVALPHCFPTLLQDHSRPLSTPANLANHTLLHDETPYEGRPD